MSSVPVLASFEQTLASCVGRSMPDEDRFASVARTLASLACGLLPFTLMHASLVRSNEGVDAVLPVSQSSSGSISTTPPSEARTSTSIRPELVSTLTSYSS